jgi:hypothetical protein
MWPSLPAANQIADWANIFFIGSLVVGVVSTVLIVWMSGVKEAHWEKDRTESAERIATLAAQGDQLRKDTAEANARALEAQLALERFRAPRSLTAEQQSELRAKLLPFAGTISRVWTMPAGSPDTAGLAGLLIHVLEQANWSVGRATSLSGQSFPGVVVAYRNGTDAAPQAAALVEYLNSAGVPATVAQPFDDEGGLMPASNMVSPAGLPNIVVVVGSKT